MTKQTQVTARKASNVPAPKAQLPTVQTHDHEETNQSNSPDLMQLGAQAIKLINEGDLKRGKGIAIMTFVIAQAYYSKVFETSVSGLESFTLEDMVSGVGVSIDKEGRNLTKKDNKRSNARLATIARNLFGIEGRKKDEKAKSFDYFNASQKNSFVKALNLIHNLILLKVRVSEHVQLDKDNNLMLPLWVFFKPADKVHLKTQFEAAKHAITPISSYEDMLRNVDKLLSESNLKGKRGAATRTPEQRFMDSLGDITLKAKEVANAIEGGKILKIDIATRRKMQETLMAIQKAFDAEKRAEQKANDDDQKELQAKAKAKA